MRAFILAAPEHLTAVDVVAPPTPGPGQVMVRVARVGICGTDIHSYRGQQPFFAYPRRLGHELSGWVESLGADVTGLAVGDVVAVEPYLQCHQCGACRLGRYNCCEHLQVLGVHIDGGMCEQVCLPAAKVHRACDLTVDQAVLVETLAVGAHAVARARLAPGEAALVVGGGPIGLAVALLALAAGARVALLEPEASRRAVAAQALAGRGGPGAWLGTLAPPVAAESAAPGVREHFSGESPACVFDATGKRAAMEAAFALPAAAGRLVLVGFQADPISFANPEFHRRELTLLSSRNSTAADFDAVLALMRAGLVDAAAWLTHRAGPQTFPESLADWLVPGSGLFKGVLAWDAVAPGGRT
jgi:2-desacetyl-2-hydroxyethyl bacteriochlorophyllide A dehydrogenase